MNSLGPNLGFDSSEERKQTREQSALLKQLADHGKGKTDLQFFDAQKVRAVS